jgi:hypothetical protein
MFPFVKFSSDAFISLLILRINKVNQEAPFVMNLIFPKLIILESIQL